MCVTHGYQRKHKGLLPSSELNCQCSHFTRHLFYATALDKYLVPLHRYLGNPANAGIENTQMDLTSPSIQDRAVQQNQEILLTKSGHGPARV